MATTMKAWQYSALGKIEDTLQFNNNVPAPTKASLRKGEVLIQVLAASLNPVDLKLPQSGLVGRLMVNIPGTPGLDFCGRVLSTYDNDTNLIGKIVYGGLYVGAKYGTLGETIVAPINSFAILPDGLDVNQAAAIGTAGMTAYISLPLNLVKPGANILINGGSGGTGTFGCQIAKILGARVTTTCSTTNVELCQSLGVDRVIDYRSCDIVSELVKEGAVYDLIVDNVGSKELFDQSVTLLKPSGSFAQVSMNPVLIDVYDVIKRVVSSRLPGTGRRGFSLVMNQVKTEGMERIGQWIVDDKLKVVVDSTYSFGEVPQAVQKVRTGRSKGKVVVRVAEE